MMKEGASHMSQPHKELGRSISEREDNAVKHRHDLGMLEEHEQERQERAR